MSTAKVPFLSRILFRVLRTGTRLCHSGFIYFWPLVSVLTLSKLPCYSFRRLSYYSYLLIIPYIYYKTLLCNHPWCTRTPLISLGGICGDGTPSFLPPFLLFLIWLLAVTTGNICSGQKNIQQLRITIQRQKLILKSQLSNWL